MIEKVSNASVLIVGTGYVGLVTATGLTKLGHYATCYDISPERVTQLKKGKSPFYEPGIEEIMAEGITANRLLFTNSLEEAYTGQRYIFVAVQTPQDANGKSDLTALRAAVTSVAEIVTKPALVIVKSTVPVGIFDELETIPAVRQNNNMTFVSCPEFLAEGTAVRDFMHPSRTVVGSNDDSLSREVAGLFYGLGGSYIITNAKTAQMIKYSANSFLATRVAFINDIAETCEPLGINVNDVTQALVMDSRVGGTYLSPSIGFAGPCLPKDLSALIESSGRVQAPALLLRGASEQNKHHLQHIVETIVKLLGDGDTVAVFGLSFKPNTDDVRNAFALTIIKALLDRGVSVRATDPQAIPAARQVIEHPALQFFDDPVETATGSDLQIFLTPWDAYKELDLKQLSETVRHKHIYDGMRVVVQQDAIESGFTYSAVGNTGSANDVFEVSDNPSLL